MALTNDLVASYVRPRQVMRDQLARGENEGRALGILLIACVVFFVAQWPGLAREAFFDPSIPLPARLGGAMMGSIMIAPLMFYALAAISHGIATLFGGRGDHFGARLALFWSLFVTTPLFLLVGLVDGFIGAGPALIACEILRFGVFVFIWLSCLIEAETQFAAP